ncbi:MAG: class D beta-lactamase [Armatimonadetes bacterium]|nr:class D beta-lactamase [Armatimonadota bacterium]
MRCFIFLVAAFAGLLACNRQPAPGVPALHDSAATAVRAIDSGISKSAPTEIERPELARYFQQVAADSGAFVLLDLSANRITRFNPTRCATGFLPASTFKIFNTLVALETGVAPDTNFSLPWDSVKRAIPNWNRDQTIAEAFRNSTVWFYQELARRIGQQRMQEWVSREGYGNQNIQGGIDKFWLTGELRISPDQQVEFLRRLFEGNVSFSKRTTEMVKQVMLQRDTLGYRLRAKTGWGSMKERQIGWIVGWVERPQGAAIFALNLESRNPNYPMMAARMEVLKGILKELTSVPNEW